MIKKFKQFIGKPIYRIPTGNSERRGIPLKEQIEEVTLYKTNKLGKTQQISISAEGSKVITTWGIVGGKHLEYLEEV